METQMEAFQRLYKVAASMGFKKLVCPDISLGSEMYLVCTPCASTMVHNEACERCHGENLVEPAVVYAVVDHPTDFSEFAGCDEPNMSEDEDGCE